MPKGAITQYIDVAQIVLYTFWVFFAGLIFYLRREDKREGYPLVYDRKENAPYLNFPPIPAPKTYLLANGDRVQAPRPDHETQDIRAVPTAAWPGAPLEPIGDPMLDAVGPGAYALREDTPDRTYEGLPKIVPLRLATTMHLDQRDPDPRGMAVIGADREVAGIVRDVWVDRSEVTIRYLEVEVLSQLAPLLVLLPMTFSKVDKKWRTVKVEAILASQFAQVPVTKSPDQVTLREEDRICAYYGGGTLYATPGRVESVL
jgi:photosynthetic reaction center H subunit